MDVTKPDALDKLEQYKEQGALGVRLSPMQRSQGDDPLAIWRKADELGLVVSSMGSVDDNASDEFHSLVAELPNLPIVIEHFAGGGEGAAFPRNGPGAEAPHTKLKKVLELANYSNTYIKIHGLAELLNRPPALPVKYDLDFYGEVSPIVQMIQDAFGPQRIMWGSDYPPVSQREGYRNALRGILEHPAFDSQEDREWVMSKTALSVFKFDG